MHRPCFVHPSFRGRTFGWSPPPRYRLRCCGGHPRADFHGSPCAQLLGSVPSRGAARYHGDSRRRTPHVSPGPRTCLSWRAPHVLLRRLTTWWLLACGAGVASRCPPVLRVLGPEKGWDSGALCGALVFPGTSRCLSGWSFSFPI